MRSKNYITIVIVAVIVFISPIHCFAESTTVSPSAIEYEAGDISFILPSGWSFSHANSDNEGSYSYFNTNSASILAFGYKGGFDEKTDLSDTEINIFFRGMMEDIGCDDYSMDLNYKINGKKYPFVKGYNKSYRSDYIIYAHTDKDTIYVFYLLGEPNPTKAKQAQDELVEMLGRIEYPSEIEESSFESNSKASARNTDYDLKGFKIACSILLWIDLVVIMFCLIIINKKHNFV